MTSDDDDEDDEDDDGLQPGRYQNPKSEKEKEDEQTRSFLIAVPIALIIAGVIFLIMFVSEYVRSR